MTLLETQPMVVVAPPAPEAPPTVVRQLPEPNPPAPPPPGRRRRARVALALAAAVIAVVASLLVATGGSGTTARGPAVAPAGVRLTSVDATSLGFTWLDPMTTSPVVAYEILRNGIIADVVAPVQTSYDAAGLATGRTYRFQVVAVFANALSAPSVTITATPH